jgi:hypothetical protein
VNLQDRTVKTIPVKSGWGFFFVRFLNVLRFFWAANFFEKIEPFEDCAHLFNSFPLIHFVSQLPSVNVTPLLIFWPASIPMYLQRKTWNEELKYVWTMCSGRACFDFSFFPVFLNLVQFLSTYIIQLWTDL